MSELIKRPELPARKHRVSKAERPLLAEHCRKMVRDGLMMENLGPLNIAAAVHNIKEYGLHEEYGRESWDETVQGEFGLSLRQAQKYYRIGEQLSLFVGGGVITQESMIEDLALSKYSTRIGINKLDALARCRDGIRRLLTSTNDAELDALFAELKSGGLELLEQSNTRRKTELKTALTKRFGPTNPASDTDLSALGKLAAREFDQLAQAADRLLRAARSRPPEDLRRSVRFRKLAQRIYNRMRELDEIRMELAQFIDDQVATAGAIIRRAQDPEDAEYTDTDPITDEEIDNILAPNGVLREVEI